MAHMKEKDTIVSLISSPTSGSICMIRVSGPQAIIYANILFSSVDLEKSQSGRFFYGSLYGLNNKLIDYVILLLYRGPNSYTGEDVVELSCHANAFIVEEIINAFVDRGCRMAEPGEFTKRAFLNGKIDLVQAEAVAEIIASKSKAGITNALKQIDGILSGKVRELKSELIQLLVLTEIDLDFSEDDLEIIDSKDLNRRVETIIKELDGMISSFYSGQFLNRGIEVAIVGRTNVGKSTLMNQLLNRERVIVSEIPGTTRDVVHDDTMISDTMFRFIDTAGIRLTDDEVESIGVRKTREILKYTDLVVYLIDISSPMNSEDGNNINEIKNDLKKNLVVVGNKLDIEHGEWITQKNILPELDILKISAREGTNIDLLKGEILERLKIRDVNLSEDVIVTNQRQYQSLKSAKDYLKGAQEAINKKMSNEFVSFDLRAAIEDLSQIIGEVYSDDILNEIFSNFCIGK